MNDKRIIAVAGATGSQGGGLVRAILDDPSGPFAVRALTRNPDSAKAKAFAERGADVVRANLDDEASVRAAFDGTYGAFVVTNFWEQLTPEQEAKRPRGEMENEQARNAARAAKAAGLKHVVWSTLEDTRPHFTYSGSEPPNVEGDYKVPHFDAKAEANTYFTEMGVPTTFLETTFYYEAFLDGHGPRRDANGQVELAMPIGESVLALVASEDIGRTAYAIFKAGGRYIGRTVNLAGMHATGKELAEMFAKVLGEPVTYRPPTHDEMRGAGFPFADEIGNMYQFFTESADSFVGQRDLDVVRALNPQLRPLDDWLSAHADELKSMVGRPSGDITAS
jgi:uncharacterized protein YbjT (DUF2867 family)